MLTSTARNPRSAAARRRVGRTARDGCGMTGPMARTEPDTGLALAGHPLQALFARARPVASAAAHAQCSGGARPGGRASVRSTVDVRILECTHRGHRPVLIGNVAARRAIPLSRQRLRSLDPPDATPSVFLPMLSAVCQLASTIRRRGASDTTVSQHDDRDQEAVSRRRVRRRNRSVTRLAAAGRRERVGSHGSLILGQEPLRPVSRAIIVGYDGTALGRKAVVEAGLRAWPAGCVFVVHAYRSPPGYLASPYTERRVSAARAAGRRLLEDLFGDGGLPDVEYIPELISGRPIEAIARVAAARDADAIVIGARPTGRVRTILSAVSRQRLLTPAVPVILIPEARNGRRGDGGAAADEDSRIPPIDAWW